MRSGTTDPVNPVHLVILRAAGLLAPGESRAEWLAEWQAELWYASKECRPELVGGKVGYSPLTAFCLGSFKDALWLRRNAARAKEPAKRWLESPKQCVAFLATLAFVSVLTASLLWPGSHGSMPSVDIQGSFVAFKFLLTFGCYRSAS